MTKGIDKLIQNVFHCSLVHLTTCIFFGTIGATETVLYSRIDNGPFCNLIEPFVRGYTVDNFVPACTTSIFHLQGRSFHREA